MLNSVLKLSLQIAVISLLAACGGGGGGSSSDPVIPFTSVSDLPADGTVEYQGQARTARFIFDPNTGQVSLTDVSTSAADSTMQITFEDGSPTNVRLNAINASTSFIGGSDSTLAEVPPFFVFESNDGDRFAVFINAGFNGDFEHQIFGTWLTGLTSVNGSAGAGAYGAITPIANMPSGQIASYEGIGVGYARLDDGEDYNTFSLVSVTTDFLNVQISSVGTDVESLVDGDAFLAPELDFSGSGPIAGAGFTASISGPATSGEAEGQFNGPNAGEVAGTYGLSGPGGVTHIGAFGAN